MVSVFMAVCMFVSLRFDDDLRAGSEARGVNRVIAAAVAEGGEVIGAGSGEMEM